jgi:hypothetical protein
MSVRAMLSQVCRMHGLVSIRAGAWGGLVAALWLCGSVAPSTAASTEEARTEAHRPVVGQQEATARRRSPSRRSSPSTGLGGVRRSLLGTKVRRTTRAISKQIRGRVRKAAQRRVKGDAGPVRAAAFTADGSLLFTASADNAIRAWSFETGGVIYNWSGQPAGVNDLAVSPNQRYLASAGGDGSIWIYSLNPGERVQTLSGHAGGVRAIAFHPQGQYLGSGGDDGTGRIWDVTTGELIMSEAQHGGPVTAVGWTVDSRYFVTGGADGEARMWKIGDRAEPIRLGGGRGAISALTLSPDGRYLTTAHAGGELLVWDVSARRQVRDFRGHEGATLKVAMGSDPTRLATAGADGVARLWDIDTGREVQKFRGHAGAIRAVSLAPDGKTMVTGSEDGTNRVWRTNDGKELAAIIATRDGWAVFNEVGQFDAPENSFPDIDWVVDEKVYGLDNFSEQYYEPGLLARVVAGETVEQEGLEDMSEGIGVPPDVRFLSPQAALTVRRNELDVQVAALDGGGGVSEVLLYHNGRLIGRSRLQDEDLDKKSGTISVTYQAKLLDGDNIFRAVAFSESGIEGLAKQVKVFFDGSVGRSTLHVLAIGINEYSNRELNLDYGVPDAQSIADMFSKTQGVAFDEVRIVRLLNGDATGPAILSALEDMQRTAPQDVVVVYYAGHGQAVDREWYMLPTELNRIERDEILRVGITGSAILDLLSDVEAQNVLLLIDSCKSGRAVTAFRGFKMQRNLRNLARRLGVHVLAATEKEQLATELPVLGHGTFTYALLEGADGPADRIRDGNLAVTEWVTYAEERIPQLLKELNLPVEQRPLAFSWGNDFYVMSVQ